MATEQEQIDVIKADIVDVKIRLTVAESNIQEISKKIDKIDANISKLTWIVIGAVVLAVLRIAFKGGF